MENNLNIQIRRANISDIEQINRIEDCLEHRIISHNILSSTLDKDNYYYFIAIIDNNIVGYISTEFLVDHFDILAIAVLENYRRRNIGSILLNHVIAVCKELNINDIFLEVRCNNISAIKFYEKIGFHKISTRKNYYKDTNEDAYIYKKVV